MELDEGLAALGLPLPDVARERLLDYLALLAKWNRVYNLTAIREPRAMLVQHLLDSLAVVPRLVAAGQVGVGTGDDIGGGAPQEAGALASSASPTTSRARESAPEIADIGSGAGLPGIPIAIACPDARLTLVETVDKKAAFLRQAVGDLGLAARVAVAGARVQSLRPHRPYDLITCRAYASLADFVVDVGGIAGAATRLAALKGERPDDEIAALPYGWRVDDVETLTVPFLDAQRHLVWLSRG